MDGGYAFCCLVSSTWAQGTLICWLPGQDWRNNRLATVFPGATCFVSRLTYFNQWKNFFVGLNVLYIPRYESKYFVSGALNASYGSRSSVLKNEAERDPSSSSGNKLPYDIMDRYKWRKIIRQGKSKFLHRVHDNTWHDQ
jgi:hypothetical protein